jgi:hypothetical protein
MPEQRIIDQITLFVNALPDLRVHPANWQELDDFDYLYQAGALLTRDEHVDRVVDVVRRTIDLQPLDPNDDGDAALIRAFQERGEFPEGRLLIERPLAGMARLRFPERAGVGSVPDLMERIDEQVEPNAATPEHLVHACGHCCPAKEPDVVPQNAVPVPPVRAECGCVPPCDGEGIKVSLVDTGFIKDADTAHEWLGHVEGDEEVTVENGKIVRYGGHGTFGAGCIRVTAPRAAVYVHGTLTTVGAEYESALGVRLAEALQRAPDVLVFTFSTQSRDEQPLVAFDKLYESEIRHRKGLVVLAPACNDAVSTRSYPAAYDWVVGVGALSEDWRARADFTNFGPWVNVYAPGTNLVNAYATGTLDHEEFPSIGGADRVFEGMASWSGTSFSTPLVAGMIAARMSATGESGRQAADALLALAGEQGIGGVGPVLYPEQACRERADAHRHYRSDHWRCCS